MMNIRQFLTYVFLLPLLCLAAVACGKDQQKPEDTSKKVSSVSLNEAEITLTIGETSLLEMTVSPENAVYETVIWESGNEDVATVDQSGLVSAIGEGSAVITATVDGMESPGCTVNVTFPEPDPIEVESVQVTPSEAEINVDDDITLEAVVLPENADYELVWSSSNTSVATVDENGKVTAVAAGQAEIMASAGDKQGICEITVLKVAAEPQVGDYFYSDGTWSSELDEGKTTVGIVFYIGQHAADITDYSATGIEAAQCKGYVVALEDATDDKCVWGEFSTELGNYMIDDSGNPVDEETGDPDLNFNGYTYTQNMIAAAQANGGLSADDPAGYPAAYHISNYMAAPSNTSGWFLPTGSQLLTIKSLLETLTSKEGFEPFLTDFADYYWASSESSWGIPDSALSYAVIVNFRKGDQGFYGAVYNGIKDSEKFSVRAVLAF